ncbi:hypothetical protein SACOL1755 [Staphylococcus aureus subsp. aureus COL]|uniref:Uncharacterized protein n=1 Tax=Staphylococcus aureus (strain COL) TaxID=93062 RepID=A0A0H2X2A7_STAAC|nr:hypothetical protein SACOL1755 [Staphylococcus aureus subsp. aureus COL]
MIDHEMITSFEHPPINYYINLVPFCHLIITNSQILKIENLVNVLARF